jgi:hypothetical protein
MESFLTSLLEKAFDQAPNVAIYLIAAIVLIWATVKIYSFCSRVNGYCASHDGAEKEMKKMNYKMTILMDKFNSLVSALHASNHIKDTKMFNINSPISLTDEGIKFIEEIGFKSALNNEDNRKSIFESLDKLKLSTKADVESFSLIILNELYGSRNANAFTPIKNFLYEHAHIDKQKAVFACSIYLRDEYLKSHPEIL